MKRLGSLAIVLGLILLVAIPTGVGQVESAAPEKTRIISEGDGAPWQFESGDKVVGKTEVITGDLVFNGQQLEIDGKVKGDLIILAGNIVINGEVEGSIIGLTGGKLTVNGKIGRNLRVLAQEIFINGSIDGTATIAAFRVVTAPGSRIGNGLMGTFLQLNLAGRIEGQADISGLSSTRIGGIITGNLKVSGRSPEWTTPLEVRGTVFDASLQANDPSKIKGVAIGGYRIAEGNPVEQYQYLKLAMSVWFIWLVGSLLISLIFHRLFPRAVWSMSEPSMSNFRRSLVIGFGCLLGIPVLIYFLGLTMVGIPIAILGLLFYLLLVVGFEIPVYLWLGRLIFQSRLRPGLMIVTGALLHAPVIFFWPLGLLSVCLGIGMMIGKIRFQFREQIDLKG